MLGDVATLEMIGKEALDFRIGIEPGKELMAGDAVVHTLVEFGADCKREVGDFAVAGGHTFKVCDECSVFSFKFSEAGCSVRWEGSERVVGNSCAAAGLRHSRPPRR